MNGATNIPKPSSIGVFPGRLPRHVAIIMDGNGRWATRHGRPRSKGHRAGAKAARAIIEHAARLGLEQLTLYSFSVENWRRPAAEVGQLMGLYLEYLVRYRKMLLNNNMRFRQIGRREGLPADVCRELDATSAATKDNTGTLLCLAVNYGARAEIVDAGRRICEKVRTGRLAPEAVDEQVVNEHLYTVGMPDPDLLIRTAGEMRLSNFLLWQISYAELYVTDVYWPEFTPALFDEALGSYAARRRRFGGLDPGNSAAGVLEESSSSPGRSSR
jgi:undecaprenyl diphosphate synthase